jgi:hypothetical protein
MSSVKKIEEFIANISENNYNTFYSLIKTNEFIFDNNLNINDIFNELQLNKLQKMVIAYNLIDFIILNTNNDKIINNIDINNIKNRYVNILNNYKAEFIFNNIENKINNEQKINDNEVQEDEIINNEQKINDNEVQEDEIINNEQKNINNEQKIDINNEVQEDEIINNEQKNVNNEVQEDEIINDNEQKIAINIEQKIDINNQEEIKIIDENKLRLKIQKLKSRPKHISEFAKELVVGINKKINDEKTSFNQIAKKLPEKIHMPNQKKADVQKKIDAPKIEKSNPNATKTDSGYLFFNEHMNENYLNKKNDDGTPIGWVDITHVITNHYYDEIDQIINETTHYVDDFQYFMTSSKNKSLHAFHPKYKFWFHYTCTVEQNENQKYRIQANSINWLDENNLYNILSSATYKQ